jgi:3-hydroxyisobutyrate dehydrogenase-like beta-hydroxyacid dehydrogenase
MMRVGFIGLGDQGAPMALRIVESGYPTTVWARRPESLEQFLGTSATVAATPAELGAASDLVAVCVRDDAGVEEVLVGEHAMFAGMTAGSVVVVHSTVHPETCRRLARAAEARGIIVIDAPVSGGGVAALERRLLVMVGGDVQTFQRCRPVFETYGDPVLHLGPVGAGQIAKLVNNVLFTAHLALGTQAFELAAALDLESAAFAEVLAHASGGSVAVGTIARLGYTAATMADRAGPLLLKDVNLLSDVAASAGAPVGSLVAIADAALAIMGVSRGRAT